VKENRAGHGRKGKAHKARDESAAEHSDTEQAERRNIAHELTLLAGRILE
jgi:hypothetical protein